MTPTDTGLAMRLVLGGFVILVVTLVNILIPVDEIKPLLLRTSIKKSSNLGRY